MLSLWKVKKLFFFALVLLTIVAIFAAGIIIVSRRTPEAKKQNSLSSCNDLGNKVLGQTEEAAINKINQSDNPFRIVERDGESYPQTMDFSPDRVNLTISQGKVTAFTCY